MAIVKISHLAELDLAEIWDYISTDNINAADKTISKLYLKLENLSDFPSMGRDCSDLQPVLRVYTIDNFEAYYKIGNDIIDIVRIIHSKRDKYRIFNH